MADFWSRLDAMLASRNVVIDRLTGSVHPRFPDFVYPLDYGYLEGTTAGDGGGIDVWRGSIAPFHLVGVVCTVDSIKNDAEIKLLLGCTEDEIDTVREFHNNSAHMSCIVVMRDAGQE